MKELQFNKDSIKLLRLYLFDSSIEEENLNNLSISKQNTIEIHLERRCFENVSRKKILFFTKTYIHGMSSKLVISGVEMILKRNIYKNERFDNHFIQEIKYNPELDLLCFESVTNTKIIELKVSNNFSIKLLDLNISEFGKGVFFKKVGYTMEETNKLIENEKYIGII